MYQYQYEHLKKLLAEVIQLNTLPVNWSWLQERANFANTDTHFNTVFAAIPRKTGKLTIKISEEQEKNIQSARPGFIIKGWTVDRLARVWLLLQFDASDKEKYFRSIEGLFPGAEVNELIALYSSLPVLAYPEIWARRCAEGIRSNIGEVLRAIMCYNPYPSEQLDEPAWNQLVLKAIFTDKSLHLIIGLDKRANEKLAGTLSDFAHERWAAHRTVDPQLWRCVGKFINKDIFPDIERIANSNNPLEKQAAALACHDSRYPPAKELLDKNGNLQSAIASGKLTWDVLAEKINDYVLQ